MTTATTRGMSLCHFALSSARLIATYTLHLFVIVLLFECSCCEIPVLVTNFFTTYLHSIAQQQQQTPVPRREEKGKHKDLTKVSHSPFAPSLYSLTLTHTPYKLSRIHRH
jgi:hypothetical protein